MNLNAIRNCAMLTYPLCFRFQPPLISSSFELSTSSQIKMSLLPYSNPRPGIQVSKWSGQSNMSHEGAFVGFGSRIVACVSSWGIMGCGAPCDGFITTFLSVNPLLSYIDSVVAMEV